MPSRNHTGTTGVSGEGGVSAKKSVTPANFYGGSWYNPLEACFSPLPSTGGEIFSRHREISTVEGGDEHETSPNRCSCPASSSRRDHGSDQEEEIIRVIPEGKWFGYRKRTPGHFSLAGWLEGMLKNLPDRARHRGGAEPRNPPEKNRRCPIPPDEFRARHEAARGHFFHRSARKNRFSAIISGPAENRMFTNVSGRH